MKRQASARFFHAGSQGWLYFDANSIGAMPRIASARMAQLLAEWRALRRRGWSESTWLDAPRRLGDKLAPLIGARKGSVIVGDSTTVNLHKALVMAVQLRRGRKEILSEAGSFPTDLYVAQGVARRFGLTLKLVNRPEQVQAAISPRTAVVYLSHTDYRSAHRHDLAAVTRRAHARGALTVWDLSHSAGAVATDVARGRADFAVGCGYKYLCGGPGAPGYLYVAPRLQARVQPALQGWFGHADPMAFEPRFRAARGVQRHAVGSPAVAGNVLMEAALDIFLKMDLRKLFRKHAALTQLLIELAPEELILASPVDARKRGGFVAFRFKDAKGLAKKLEKRRVVSSARPPDILRFGLSPLYHSEADVRALARRLAAILG
jgi:kynureninase